ncbi:MAG: tetratricopeptide repeat protein [Cyclobacteriaceae bacterium]|nr:tetratricopeptide repeat protein [Cyclobacteriaceae bacterium]
MLKQRVILVVVGIVFIVIIYNLPRIVVDNDPDAGLDNQEKTAVSAGNNRDLNEAGDIHSFEISPEDKEKLTAFRKKFMDVSALDKLGIADTMASLYLDYNKYDSAAKYLEYIAINDPSAANFQSAADAYFESFSFAMDRDKAALLGEKARYYYQMILEEQPERFDVRNKIAMTYISSANPMQGIMMLRQILEEDPGNEMAIYNLGTLSIQSGQYDRSKEYFEELVRLNPKNLQAQFYLGLSYFELNEKDKARKQFELVKSMEDDPAVIATVEGYLQELN